MVYTIPETIRSTLREMKQKLKKDPKQIGIFSLVIVGALLIVFYLNKEDIDAQLFKTTDLSSIDFSKSWESFEKELHIQSDSSTIDNFQMILEKNQIYSVKFDLINESKGEFKRYRYRECLLCEEEGEKGREIITTTLENASEYSNLMDADQFFKTLNLLKEEDIIKTINYKYKMIAADGRNEEIGVEGDYYLLNNDGIHKLEKSNDGTYSGYYLHIMGNEVPEEFGTSDDSVSVFFDGQSK